MAVRRNQNRYITVGAAIEGLDIRVPLDLFIDAILFQRHRLQHGRINHATLCVFDDLLRDEPPSGPRTSFASLRLQSVSGAGRGWANIRAQ